MTTKEQVDYGTHGIPNNCNNSECHSHFHSLRTSLVEMLSEYFPKRDNMSFHDKVVIGFNNAIHSVEERARGEMAREIDQVLIIERRHRETMNQFIKADEVEAVREIIDKLSNHGGGKL